MTTVAAGDVGQKVRFLYGHKGYGEGVLLGVDGDQAKVKSTKLQDTPSCTWRRSSQEISVCARYVTVVNR